MKGLKIIKLLIPAVLSMLVCTGYAFADYIESPWVYEKDGRTVVITKYIGSDTEAFVPWSLAGLDVKKICSGAFEYANGTVYVPDNDVTVEAGAVLPGVSIEEYSLGGAPSRSAILDVDSPESDEPGDKPSDEPGDKPSDEPGDKPSDEPGDKPSDEPGDKPSDKPVVDEEDEDEEDESYGEIFENDNEDDEYYEFANIKQLVVGPPDADELDYDVSKTKKDSSVSSEILSKGRSYIKSGSSGSLNEEYSSDAFTDDSVIYAGADKTAGSKADSFSFEESDAAPFEDVRSVEDTVNQKNSSDELKIAAVILAASLLVIAVFAVVLFNKRRKNK